MTNSRQASVSKLSGRHTDTPLFTHQIEPPIRLATIPRYLDAVLENRQHGEGILVLGVDHAFEVDEVDAVFFGVVSGVLMTTEIG